MQAIADSKQTRKMQLTGGSTYVVSLPKKWIDDLKIKVGDDVTIIKNPNNSLTLFAELSAKSLQTSKSVTKISKGDSEESLRRKIIAIYMAGYKTIQIESKGVKIQAHHSRMIREMVRSAMIGTEIIESSPESFTIQVLTRLPELSFGVTLKRMYLMAANMHREAMIAFASKDEEAAEEVIKMDDEVDRFSLYMLRSLNLAVQNSQILNEVGLEKPSDCLGYRTVIRCIERIADHAALIAKRVKFLVSAVDKKLQKDLTALSEDSLNVFERAILALTKKDYNLAEKVATDAAKVVEKEKDLMYSLKESRNSNVIKFVLEDIRRTAEYSTDIAEVVMNENVQSVILEK